YWLSIMTIEFNASISDIFMFGRILSSASTFRILMHPRSAAMRATFSATSLLPPFLASLT
ncbi:MAG: hypothetical protein QXM87_08295, partial [Candidatus Bathyarchaeia archaeon]